jgi:hypothetical protein
MSEQLDEAIRGHEAFDAGITFAIGRLAKLLNVEEWYIQDGSEDHDTDVDDTIMHVLRAAIAKEQGRGAS